ncbi:MAG: nucleotide exchange factor GrpE [Verrucomicrobiales bacterium]|nr:nucleotide exchange factor GrpE [Verrucomicrobiales bacterium]MCP5527617.1 nucleotide exchange factor GrpE [Verrucomicrobiales bacterium]
MSKDAELLNEDEMANAATSGGGPIGTAPAPEPTVADGVTPEELASLKADAAKAAENWNQYLRAVADLDNYRKRAARERQDAVRYANESLLGRLLPVLDSLDRALTAAEGTESGANNALREGVQMVRTQFLGALTEAGLEEIDAAGQTFDPTLHEAVSTVEAPGIEEGQVVEQLRKGYRLQDRLLRAASVIVARAPSA